MTRVMGFLAVMALAACSHRSDADGVAAPLPVQGPSWLNARHLSVDTSLAGRLGGTQPPPASASAEPHPSHAKATYRLTGADLYRLGCQSCHGPTGAGSPPQVASLVGAVQGASAAALEKRMAAAGRSLSPEMAAQLARDARKALVTRLQKGGDKMPPFDYLTPAERDALMSYLDQLAGVPPAKAAPAPVEETAARIGVLVLRGTCQLCHDATGPGNRHAVMMGGQIPSLASLPGGWSLDAVIEKVKTGRLTGRGGMMGRGMMGRAARMPSYPYLTRQEIAAAYQALGGRVR